MDYSKIVEKALKREDYADDVKDFTPEQKVELGSKISEAAKAESDKELSRIDALRQEGKRIEDKNKATPPKDADPVLSKFKDEQEQAAKNEFKSNPKFTIPAELQGEFDETFKKLSSGEVSKDKILSVLKKTFTAVMGDKLIETSDKFGEFEKNAANFNAGGANATAHISAPDRAKFSTAAQELFTSWQKEGYVGKNYSLEQAQKITEGGFSRTL